MYVEKLRRLENMIKKEKGEVYLLAAFEHEDIQGRWDILISAEKLEADRLSSVRFVVDKLKTLLDKEEIVKVSKVILFNKNDNFVNDIKSFMLKNSNIKKINDMTIGDLYIKHGVIVKSPVEKHKQKVLAQASCI
ncbi:MAG: hypothetical protein WCR46_05400 [Deltaproteobacteria bacterium]|jgi:hypothetical protein